MTASQAGPMKVLFVAGTARSGSTLLDVLLGQIDGFFSGGEIRRLWLDGLIRGRLCGCGQPLTTCEVWSAVLADFERRRGRPTDPSTMIALQQEATDLSHLRKVLAESPGTQQWDYLNRYTDALDDLFLSIQSVTHARVLIDSSKRPTEAAVLRLLPGIDPYLLHLVRDPRGVAMSMQRDVSMQPQSEADAAKMAKSSSKRSARLWMQWNSAAELVRRKYGPERCIRVRYEDLVSRPQATLREIASFVGEPYSGANISDDNLATLKGNHTAWGNPSRFKTGEVRIRRDDAWKEQLSRSDKRTTTMIGAPLLFRYGYPLRV